MRTAHELEIKENTKIFRAVLLLFFFGGCSGSDEHEIHRCCVMCAAVYHELLRRSCEWSVVVRGEKGKKGIKKRMKGVKWFRPVMCLTRSSVTNSLGLSVVKRKGSLIFIFFCCCLCAGACMCFLIILEWLNGWMDG